MSKFYTNDHQEPEKNLAAPDSEQPGDPKACEDVKDLARVSEALLAEAQKSVQMLQAENLELKDQYLRKLADYENFRKRMFREKDDAVQFANSALLQDLLGILDDFDRAIQSSEISKDFQILHDGIAMVRNRFITTLEGKYGLSRFESAGKPFDPNIHEAVAVVQGPVKEPLISEEFLKGYTLNGRILRAAKVRVTMPKADEKTAPADSAPGAPQADAASAKTE